MVCAYKDVEDFNQRLLLRIDEVARLIGVSKATAYDLINRGEIPSVRLAGRGGRDLLRVPALMLRKLIEQRTSGDVVR
jgi:excisionase family DNA binding protein